MEVLGWTLVVSIATMWDGGLLLNSTVDGPFDPRFPEHYPTRELCERFAGISNGKYRDVVYGFRATCMRDLTESEKEELAEILKSLTVKAP